MSAVKFGLPRALPGFTNRLSNLFPQGGISITVNVPKVPNMLGNGSAAEETAAQAVVSPGDFFSGNGILLAAPKKKTSHMKKRQRLLAPGKKHHKMLTNLDRCPSCGHYKRVHFLCMNCFTEVRNFFRRRDREAAMEAKPEEELSEIDQIDQRILYPGKEETDYQKKLKKKDYILRRSRTLPYEK